MHKALASISNIAKINIMKYGITKNNQPIKMTWKVYQIIF
jgi:hypothetical protein